MPVHAFQDQLPRLGDRVFLAPSAHLTGNVEVGDDVSFWFHTHRHRCPRARIRDTTPNYEVRLSEGDCQLSDVEDRWAAGSTYESFMGRWSRELAPKFVEWIGVQEGAHWLDVGCGTGALTAAICKVGKPATVVGCDPAHPLLEYARAHLSDDRASFVLAGVDALPRRSGGFGSVAASLSLNFFPDPGSSLEAMRDRATEGGTISSCVWDYSGRMEFLRHFWDAASRVDRSAAALDEGRRFPICQPDSLTALFAEAGLSEIRCEPIDISTNFSSFEEYWGSFQGGTGPAPSYVASLGSELRAALSSDLENELGANPDGSICLTARAWAIRGTAS